MNGFEQSERIMKQEKKSVKPTKKDIFLGILMLATGIAITVAGIHCKQNFFRIMPLYVSLIIGFLQSRVNRYTCRSPR